MVFFLIQREVFLLKLIKLASGNIRAVFRFQHNESVKVSKNYLELCKYPIRQTDGTTVSDPYFSDQESGRSKEKKRLRAVWTCNILKLSGVFTQSKQNSPENKVELPRSQFFVTKSKG